MCSGTCLSTCAKTGNPNLNEGNWELGKLWSRPIGASDTSLHYSSPPTTSHIRLLGANHQLYTNTQELTCATLDIHYWHLFFTRNSLNLYWQAVYVLSWVHCAGQCRTLPACVSHFLLSSSGAAFLNTSRACSQMKSATANRDVKQYLIVCAVTMTFSYCIAHLYLIYI